MRRSLVLAVAASMACGSPTPPPPVPIHSLSVESPYEDNFVQIARYTHQGVAAPQFVEILDVEVAGRWLYVCAATQGLLKIDLEAPDLPIVSAVEPSAGATRCQHVEADGERVIVANRGDEYAPVAHVTLFDGSITPPHSMEVANITSDTLSFEGLEVLSPGHYAVAMHDRGVAVLTQERGSLVEQARIEGFSNAWDLALSGDYLYVADGFDGVRVVDASRSRDGTIDLVGQVPLQGPTKHVEVGGGMLFASAGSEGVHMLSLADPAAPMLVATIETPGSAVMSAYADGHLFVADWNDVRVYDVTNEPRRVAIEKIEANLFSRVLAIDARDDRAYIGEWTGQFEYQLLPPTVAPDVAVDQYGLNFPTTEPGAQTARTLIIGNEGDAPLEVVGVSHDDTFVPQQQTLTVAPGDAQPLEFRFTPDNEHPAEAWLTIYTDDPDEAEIDILMRGNSYGIGVGDPIPDYEWIDLQSGGEISMQSLRGQVVLLSYFATF